MCTPHGVHIERIIYDPRFFSDMCIKLDNFFVKVILPLVLCGTEKENTCHPSEPSGKFCYCRKGRRAIWYCVIIPHVSMDGSTFLVLIYSHFLLELGFVPTVSSVSFPHVKLAFLLLSM